MNEAARPAMLRRRMKSFAGRVLFGLRAERLLGDPSPLIVTFHRVNDRTAGDALTCSTELFERQCTFLAEHFHPLSLSDLVARVESGTSRPREVAITFDDGYADNHDCAAPVLKRLGLPATFFVTTDFIGSNLVAPWDTDINPPPAWMTWEQVRSLRERGFDIGGHTRTHANLAALNEADARREIEGSRSRIESELSEAPTHFAFPFGGREHATALVRSLVREAGFHSCLSCHGGSNRGVRDPFELRRVNFSSWYITPYHFGLSWLARRA